MIPILFSGTSTDFTTNGIGRLTDCISCIVTEERNGIYDLEMTYPVNGVHFEDIKVSNLIVVDTTDTIKRQAFEIYYISKPINNIVTIRANHISYRMSYIPIKPFIAQGITKTLNGFNENAMEISPFTFWTDIENETSTYDQVLVKSMRSCLGGSDGSILDIFSGSGGVEYEWDNFLVKVYRNRGKDNGVQLRKAKNITDLTQDQTIEDTVTGVVPMWANSDNTVVLVGDTQYSTTKDDYPVNRTVVLDLSSEFESIPTKLELNQAGQKYIATQGLPNTNIKISFVNLADVEKYENINVLETINLCDTITVIDKQLNITFQAKVIKTTRDVLKNRYNSIEIGDAKSNMAQTIADNLGDIHSLQLANNKLVSVTQTLDREIGEVQTTVATVESRYEEDYDSLVNRVEYNETQILQNSQAIELRATTSYVNTELGSLETKVDTLSTTLSVESDQVKISQGDENNYVSIQDNNVTIYTDGTPATSFSNEGMTTSKVIVDEHWYQDTVNNGNSWILYYK